MKVLFISWDGPEQSYLESLFLPLYARLGAHGFGFHVLQFTWGDSRIIARTAAVARELSIPYVQLPIFRHPKLLATAASVLRGASAVGRYARRHGIDILMPRSTLPALMTLLSRRSLNVRAVYDADGFMPDERVDFAGWSSSGAMYRAFRDVEGQMLRVADSVVTRTSKAKAILLARGGAGIQPDKIHVVPNGKDAGEFQPFDALTRLAARHELGIAATVPLLIYVGSLGPQYLPQEMFEFFHAVRQRRSDAHLLMLTGQERDARAALERSGIPHQAVTIRRVAPAAVAGYVAAADLGLALRKSAFSQLGVSPIKVAEYLLCGVPVLSSTGIGDLDEQLAEGAVGRLMGEANGPQLRSAADWFVTAVLPGREELRQRCRSRGVDTFGLDRAVPGYVRALQYAWRS